MVTIPTSDLETFRNQMANPNKGFEKTSQVVEVNSQPQQEQKIKKHLVLSLISDYTGCGHIRNILPSTYLNAVFGKGHGLQIITTPILIEQPEILQRTRSILFQRTMGPQTPRLIAHYKELQKQYKFKMIYDIDDFIWDGEEDGEEIPSYNFGKGGIDEAVRQSAIDNMKLMDEITVTTQFLKDYIASRGVDKDKITIVHNTLPSFLWGNQKRKHITEPIKKPRILWSASPTHWHNEKKLCGDMENAWRDWVIKSVKEDSIEYIQMGGLPWFFEEIKDKITVIDWVNSLHYPQRVNSLNADIGIAPLVPNYFNYSKSAIKYQEYCVAGILGVGTVFSNGKPSPYDIALTKAYDTITVDEIDRMIRKLCLPENFNRTIDEQYQQVGNNDWITESAGYVNKMTSIL